MADADILTEPDVERVLVEVSVTDADTLTEPEVERVLVEVGVADTDEVEELLTDIVWESDAVRGSD